ncbi:hypothetical protein DFA_00308 [Cavenderia fasciculata]|uniref:Transmembrane protein n=1 Tax=Cavenderia fasciculata TaxID=261658 RepID=F4PY70_CACFS|nr:uncharacterized protein DFA_00308 [Cavenderia fasciculata]EGG19730.1 hypothetical protein DFA_00308 [Cavenderia fasciculata]|eukprot:XP_004358024.1 hypothetical protein DFA_00308 [Cavenderia fasciculata]
MVNSHGTSLVETDFNYKFVRIFKLSLAFSVLAWATLSVTPLFILLSMFGILTKIPLPLPPSQR